MAKIIKQDFEVVLLGTPEEMMKHIEKCGRICYKSEDKITDDSSGKFVSNIIRRGHEAVIEHIPITVFITTDRGISHELVRHRMASYCQESTRYCNYNKDKFGGHIQFIDIMEAIELDTKMKNLGPDVINAITKEWADAMHDSERHYNRMIELGATPQVARSVLSNSVKTDIVITTNPRSWRNIIEQRTPVTAHPQMRNLMIKIAGVLKQQLPLLFGDLIIE